MKVDSDEMGGYFCATSDKIPKKEAVKKEHLTGNPSRESLGMANMGHGERQQCVCDAVRSLCMQKYKSHMVEYPD